MADESIFTPCSTIFFHQFTIDIIGGTSSPLIVHIYILCGYFFAHSKTLFIILDYPSFMVMSKLCRTGASLGRKLKLYDINVGRLTQMVNFWSNQAKIQTLANNFRISHVYMDGGYNFICSISPCSNKTFTTRMSSCDGN